MKCPDLLNPKKLKQGDVNALPPHDIRRRHTTEHWIACGFRPSPRRHAHARVGSFRCRGHGGRKGCLLPPTLPTFLWPWLLRPWIWLWVPPTLLSLWLRTSLSLLEHWQSAPRLNAQFVAQTFGAIRRVQLKPA